MYKFGDGVRKRSLEEVNLPFRVGGKRRNLWVDVVDSQIPLLISRPTMTELGMILDLKKHRVEFDGTVHALGFSKSGHYTLPVCEWVDESCNVVFHMDNLAELTSGEKMEKAKKLHRQFAHASKERLIRLLKSGGCKDKDFLKQIEECCEKCEFCMKYKKPKPKPIVAMPKAEEFNQVVSMDLKEVEKGKVWLLHLIDHGTRYTAAAVVKSKRANVIVQKIFQIWISYFGSPKVFHSDCGGEFANEVFREMNEKIGVETSTTPGEAPFSNGIVERGNALLYESMMKTMEDTGCDIETALAWSVSAKNSLQNVSGYSPNQLVLGKNVNMPAVSESKPPALEVQTKSELVRENLNVLQKARENFIKAEASEKIKRALSKKLRTYSEVNFESGDMVYYKRRMQKGWKGPGRVLGKEGNFVLLRHGSTFYRCHPSQLMKENQKEVENHERSQPTIKQNTSKPRNKQNNHTMPAHASDSTSDEDETEREEDEVSVEERDPQAVPEPQLEENEERDPQAVPEPQLEENEEENPENQNESQQENMQHERQGIEEEHYENGDVIGNRTENPVPREDTVEEESADQEISSMRIEDSQSDHDNGAQILCSSDKIPRKNTVIRYSLEGEIHTAKVLSKQPTRRGKNRNWVNLQNSGTDKGSSVDWEEIDWWREVSEHVNQVLILTDVEQYDQDVIDAKQKELNNLKEHSVYESVEDVGQKTVSSKWVVEERVGADGNASIKARLVARGFEEDMSNKKIDSPTCSRQALRMVYTTAATCGWDICSLDVKSAFLQGNMIKREVYVKPPKDIRENGCVWKLKRCLYGLSDAPREWYDKLSKKLIEFGGKISKFDKTMFMWHDDDGKLVGLVTVHVDDLIYCGDGVWHETVINMFAGEFKVKSMDSCSFRYLGLNIEQDGGTVYVDQKKYVQELKETVIDETRKEMNTDKLTEKEQKQLRSMCGQLLWATSQTRPDVAYESCVLSNSGKDATVQNLLDANCAVRHLKAADLKIQYPGLGNVNNIQILAYGDATHASLPTGESQGANIIFMSGNGKVAPMSWKSKKLERVTKSPLASEVSAVADAADSGYLIAEMTKEIFNLKKRPKIIVFTDSKSLQQHLQSTRTIQDARLRVDIARLKQMMDLEEIEMRWVCSKSQLADSLTKKGSSAAQLIKVLVSGRI